MRKSVVVDEEAAAQVQARLRGLRKSIAAEAPTALLEENQKLKEENELLSTRLKGLRKSVSVDAEEAAQMQERLRGLRQPLSSGASAVSPALVAESAALKDLKEENARLLHESHELMDVNFMLEQEIGALTAQLDGGEEGDVWHEAWDSGFAPRSVSAEMERPPIERKVSCTDVHPDELKRKLSVALMTLNEPPVPPQPGGRVQFGESPTPRNSRAAPAVNDGDDDDDDGGSEDVPPLSPLSPLPPASGRQPSMPKLNSRTSMLEASALSTKEDNTKERPPRQRGGSASADASGESPSRYAVLLNRMELRSALQAIHDELLAEEE
eukprot:2622388-Prymnesium_polylepis.1